MALNYLGDTVFVEWNMLGQSFRLSERWMGPIITKILITMRWRFNTLIDGGQAKLVDGNEEQWNTLVRRWKVEDLHILSKQRIQNGAIESDQKESHHELGRTSIVCH